jgi:hypothetical protein
LYIIILCSCLTLPIFFFPASLFNIIYLSLHYISLLSFLF